MKNEPSNTNQVPKARSPTPPPPSPTEEEDPELQDQGRIKFLIPPSGEEYQIVKRGREYHGCVDCGSLKGGKKMERGSNIIFPIILRLLGRISSEGEWKKIKIFKNGGGREEYQVLEYFIHPCVLCRFAVDLHHRLERVSFMNPYIFSLEELFQTRFNKLGLTLR